MEHSQRAEMGAVELLLGSVVVIDDYFTYPPTLHTRCVTQPLDDAVQAKVRTNPFHSATPSGRNAPFGSAAVCSDG